MSAKGPDADPGNSQSGVSCSIEDRDRFTAITILGLLGVLTALVMAGFGLPPVDIHGPLHYIGIMDPFCGGTRAARYTAMGNLQMAWKYNPLGIVAVIAAGAAVARALVGLATGRWVTPSIHWTRQSRTATAIIIAALLVGLEIRQQLLAETLLAR